MPSKHVGVKMVKDFGSHRLKLVHYCWYGLGNKSIKTHGENNIGKFVLILRFHGVANLYFY
jgi:hypothetical protein